MIVCGKVKREYIFVEFNTTFFDPRSNTITVFARNPISISRCGRPMNMEAQTFLIAGHICFRLCDG